MTFDLPSLVLPFWPQASLNENKGYIGASVVVLMLLALIGAVLKRSRAESSTRFSSQLIFAAVLTAFRFAVCAGNAFVANGLFWRARSEHKWAA
jgi:hypothetical protein